MYKSGEGMPESAPAPVIQPRRSMRNLEDDLIASYELLEKDCSDRRVVVGRVEEYSPEELLSAEHKFSLVGDEIMIWQTPSPPHESVRMEIGMVITESLNSIALIGNFGMLAKHKLIETVDHYNCGRRKAKIPDGLIHNHRLPCRKVKGRLMAIEVSYRNESFVELLWEGVQILSETTDCLYCLLVNIEENDSKTDMISVRFILMQRRHPYASDVQMAGKYQCIKSPFERYAESSSITPEELIEAEDIFHVRILFDETHFFDQGRPSERRDLTLDSKAIDEWFDVQSPLFTYPEITVKWDNIVDGLDCLREQLTKFGLYSPSK